MTSRSLFRRTTSIACSLVLLFSVFVALGFSLVQANAGAATGPGTAVLSAGQQLLPGQELDDGPYRAVMQTDGNFVVYNASTPMWSTHTSGHMNQGFHLVMQGDGNLVMYSGSGAVKWATYRFGSSPVLVLWNNGNLIVFGASAPLWASGVTGPVYTPPTSSPTSTSSTTTSSTTTTTTSTTTTTAPRANSICSVTADTLQSGCVMTDGQSIQSGTTLLWLQSGFTAPTLNGNLVLYPNFVSLMNTGPASWTTFTFDNPSTSHHALVMEAGGNLVLYSQWISAANPGTKVWSAKDSTPSMTLVPGSFLQVLSNGNLIIKTPGGATAWATGTISSTVPSTVGVYDYPSSSQALNDGWKMVGDTGALGSSTSPYVRTANAAALRATASATRAANAPWLSFWTVSGPPGASCTTGAALGVGVYQQGASLNSGPFTAVLQTDGNFVVYNAGVPLWSTATNVAPGSFASLGQPFTLVVGLYGDLEIVNRFGTVMWQSIDHGGSLGIGATLHMQCDGNLVLTNSGGGVIWSSDTGGHTTSSPAGFYQAGLVAGQNVAAQLNNAGLAMKPTLVILDPEGYPDNHSGLESGPSASWANMMAGWAAGLGSNYAPAFYATQYEYSAFGLSSINMPALIAVAFGPGGSNFSHYGTLGSNVQGIIAWGVTCAPGTTIAEANYLASWGYRYNTLEFINNTACHP